MSSLSLRSIRTSLLGLIAICAPFGAGGALHADDIGWQVNYHISLGETWYVNMETGQVSSTNDSSYDFRLECSTESGTQRVILAPIDQAYTEGGVLYDFSEAKNLGADATVGVGSGDYWTGGAMVTQYNSVYHQSTISQFPEGDTGYAGVAFGGESGRLYYGWVAFVRDEGSTSVTGTLTGFGYNNISSADATTGAIPEPGTIGLLAAAGVALLAWRRRSR